MLLLAVRKIVAAVARLTYLLIHVLQILQPVGDVFLVTDVVLGDLMLATDALEDAVDQVGERHRLVAAILFEPVPRNSV